MRHFLAAGLTLLAASTAAAEGSAPQTLHYTVSNFYAYWSLGHVIETSFDLKEKDTNKDIAHCNGKAPSSLDLPPDDQPFDVGNCEIKDPGSQVTATVGGSPGQNFLIYLKDTQSIPCGPQKVYEAKFSFSDSYYSCKSLEQNGNSAKCYQKAGTVIEVLLNKYFEGKPADLHPRDAQADRC